MSILDRIRRIARANLHDALDKAENPERMTRQRIRELETAVTNARQAIADFAVNLKKLQKEREQACWLASEWQQKAEASLKIEDTAMARKALVEKVKAEERAATLQPAVTQSETTHRELREHLAAMTDQLRDAKLKLTELTSRQQAAEARKTFARKGPTTGTGGLTDDADFNRLETRVLQSEAEAEIEREAAADVRDVMADIDDRSRDLKVDAELAALQRKMGR